MRRYQTVPKVLFWHKPAGRLNIAGTSSLSFLGVARLTSLAGSILRRKNPHETFPIDFRMALLLTQQKLRAHLVHHWLCVEHSNR